MQSGIRSTRAFRIWDSRGRPTVEVEVTLVDGTVGRGIAPAGASRGSNEAVDLRDGGAAQGGFGVTRAVANVDAEIADALARMDACDQGACDRVLSGLDRTATKERLGGNAVVATSMAVLDAAARHSGVPVWKHLSGAAPVRMPLPQVQIFGGGAHAGRRTDIQDFLVMPLGAQTFDEALVMCADVYRAAGEQMQRRGKRFGVADEGGWWPDFESNEQALQVLTASIDEAGYGHGEVMICLDIAASEFGRAGHYRLALGDHAYDTAEWLEQLSTWITRYPIVSVEDPVAEDDEEGMRLFTEAWGRRLQVIGDDFLVTSAARIDKAAAGGCCNAVLLKPNQVGTLTETFEALQRAKLAGWGTVVSARSGETEDVLITHLAVGWNAGQLKVGSFARSERMAKWNEGLRIERSGLATGGFAGAGALPVERMLRNGAQ
jgi:enolase